jgi:DNA-binding HxlR family transcriptional regulator
VVDEVVLGEPAEAARVGEEMRKRRSDRPLREERAERFALTDRLSRLVAEGIFERVLYQERPARYEYRLTQKGADLFTALSAIRQWGDQYLCPKPMRLLRRKGDEKPVIAALVPEGAPVLAADEIELIPGPGFPLHTSQRL